MVYDYKHIFKDNKGYYNSKEFHSWQARGGRAYMDKTEDRDYEDREALELFLRDFERESSHKQSTIFEFI